MNMCGNSFMGEHKHMRVRSYGEVAILCTQTPNATEIDYKYKGLCGCFVNADNQILLIINAYNAI